MALPPDCAAPTVRKPRAGFNRYFATDPLQSSLKQANLTLDVDTANAEVLKWLRDVANNRTHKTTGNVPAVRLEQERQALQSLPVFHAAKTH